MPNNIRITIHSLDYRQSGFSNSGYGACQSSDYTLIPFTAWDGECELTSQASVLGSFPTRQQVLDAVRSRFCSWQVEQARKKELKSLIGATVTVSPCGKEKG